MTAATPTAPVENRKVERTLRITGTTAAEKYVNIVSPRMEGSRGRRGRDAGGQIGVRSNVTVSSTSSVASSSSISQLSQTGLVASSSGAASRGGGASGTSATAGGSRLGSTTGRVGMGGGSSARSGNVQLAGQAAATAMGSSGLGSTSSGLSGGSQGPPAIGGRRRGDFQLVLQKLTPAGTMVKQGDVIAEFDRQYIQTRLEDYQAAVVMHRANVSKSKADVAVVREAHTQTVETARSGLEKARLDMRTIPVLSPIQAERTRLALDEAQAEYQQRLEEVKFQRISEDAQVKETELDLREAAVELKRAELNAEKLLVRAPIDGMTVLMNTFRNGEFGQVREGDELWSGQPFLQVVDLTSMVINAMVNQADAEKLRIGQRARVTFDAFPGLEAPARVYSIGTVAKPRQYRREYVTEIPVLLKLEGSDPRIIPDLTVAADVVLETAEEAPVIPRGAVFHDERGGQPYVLVREGKDWVRRDVELGVQDHLSTSIRSGLKPGEEVATAPPAQKKSRN